MGCTFLHPATLANPEGIKVPLAVEIGDRDDKRNEWRVVDATGKTVCYTPDYDLAEAIKAAFFNASRASQLGFQAAPQRAVK